MNTESQIACVSRPYVWILEEGSRQDRSRPPQYPLLSLRGLHASIGRRVQEPLAPWKRSDKLIHGKPIHNGADFAPSKDRALLIIQGTVQLCKSVGSLCPTAVFCRSPGRRGCPEPKQLGTREPPSPGKGE